MRLAQLDEIGADFSTFVHPDAIDRVEFSRENTTMVHGRFGYDEDTGGVTVLYINASLTCVVKEINAAMRDRPEVVMQDVPASEVTEKMLALGEQLRRES